MTEVRRTGLILVEDVRDLISQGTPFRVRYDLVGNGRDGQPRYQCVYLVEEDGETVHYTLIRRQPGPYGVQPREFNLYPGLVRHHRDYGDGSRLSLSARDWTIRLVPDDEDAADGEAKREA